MSSKYEGPRLPICNCEGCRMLHYGTDEEIRAVWGAWPIKITYVEGKK